MVQFNEGHSTPHPGSNVFKPENVCVSSSSSGPADSEPPAHSTGSPNCSGVFMKHMATHCFFVNGTHTQLRPLRPSNLGLRPTFPQPFLGFNHSFYHIKGNSSKSPDPPKPGISGSSRNSSNIFQPLPTLKPLPRIPQKPTTQPRRVPLSDALRHPDATCRPTRRTVSTRGASIFIIASRAWTELTELRTWRATS